MLTHLKLFTIIIGFVLSDFSFANNDLSIQLKNYQPSLDHNVKTLLDQFADKNNQLNSIELGHAAFIAARVNEWEIAGFYYLAAHIQTQIDMSGFEHVALNQLDLKKIYKNRLKVFEAVKSNKLFKEARNKGTQMNFISDQHHKIKEHLIQNPNDLKKAIHLYNQWKPYYSDSYQPIVPIKSRQTDTEIRSLFDELNVVYQDSNTSILKLLEIPRYQELKLIDMNNFTKQLEIIEKGKKPQLEEIKNQIAVTREMEQIEMDNYLFHEISWGNWF